jgi:ketosteroid isomerase-like protein
MEGTTDIRELRVLGDWAFIRNTIDVTMTPPGGAAPVRHAGWTLGILRKEGGRWLLARDANLVAAAPSA